MAYVRTEDLAHVQAKQADEIVPMDLVPRIRAQHRTEGHNPLGHLGVNCQLTIGIEMSSEVLAYVKAESSRVDAATAIPRGVIEAEPRVMVY